MTLSERIWTMASAAMLALAVVCIWPPEDQGFALLDNHGAQSSPQRHHIHAVQNGHCGVPQISLAADCDGSSFGCCVMTICHPAISVETHEMPFVAAGDETTVASALLGLGSEPEVILHPPRLVMV